MCKLFELQKCFSDVSKVEAAVHQESVFTWAGFTSTSRDEEVARKFGPYIFMINGEFGRDISQFSEYPHEREVLFVPGTRLDVVQVNRQSCHLRERMHYDINCRGP